MIVKQMEIRSNIKKYFDMAYYGDPIIVPRKENKNIVIISEEEYSRLNEIARIQSYSDALFSRSTSKVIPIAQSATGDIKSENLHKLEQIRKLKNGWNGNGAPAFSGELINRIKMLIETLEIQPEVFPTALGSIQLEYDNARHDHLEIDIGDNDRAEIFMVKNSGEEVMDIIDATSQTINEKVREFYG